ncbi:MAG: C40 family peptidase [Synechococcus sp. Tobar2m-G35]|nr:C40 family peptidase [Synechococcus sp. Tobar2m-G35]
MASVDNPVADGLRLLQAPLDLHSRPGGAGLATQALAGRRLRLLAEPPQGERRLVELLEDGYRGWCDQGELDGRTVACGPHRPRLLDAATITSRLPQVIGFALAAAAVPNRYLWGGTLGPDYDCSGLMQMAFASAGIWIPRDAYQQERFCSPVATAVDDMRLLRPGDLIFFGTARRCTHVGLHLGAGRYLHSSGISHGRNGIGTDSLHSRDDHPVAGHYRAELRGAGRVERCHDGTHLP